MRRRSRGAGNASVAGGRRTRSENAETEIESENAVSERESRRGGSGRQPASGRGQRGREKSTGVRPVQDPAQESLVTGWCLLCSYGAIFCDSHHQSRNNSKNVSNTTICSPACSSSSVRERDRERERSERPERNEKDRDYEDEEEMYERKRMERKMREKEAAYQEVTLACYIVNIQNTQVHLSSHFKIGRIVCAYINITRFWFPDVILSNKLAEIKSLGSQRKKEVAWIWQRKGQGRGQKDRRGRMEFSKFFYVILQFCVISSIF